MFSKAFLTTGISAALLISQAVAQTPAISKGGVVNAASFEAGKAVAPGSLVAIFGNELAPGLALADSVPLATSLANVRVTFNGRRGTIQFHYFSLEQLDNLLSCLGVQQ